MSNSFKDSLNSIFRRRSPVRVYTRREYDSLIKPKGTNSNILKTAKHHHSTNIANRQPQLIAQTQKAAIMQAKAKEF